MPRIALRFVLLVALAVLAARAEAATKAALVIGNGAYQNVTRLVNPVNDAADMAAALQRIGYAVTLVTDGDLSAMNNGLRSFLRDADHADAALVFYSGHGVQVKGDNYLLPVSAKIEDELDLDTQSLSLSKLRQLVDSASPKVQILIMDACRDNPLARQLVRGGGTRGLARIDLDPSSSGTLIAYSTAPGSVAQDGSGRNSPFTQALLSHIETPDLDIRQMFGEVRADVDRVTQGAQRPWVEEAIIGSFAMSGAARQPGAVKLVQQQPAQPAAPVQPPQQPVQPPPEQQASLQPVPIPDAPVRQQPSPAREFIFADSGSRRLSWNDLSGLNAAQLRVARNEIFARRGRFMKDAQLRAYFSQFSWYQPFTWDVQLSAVEKANVALIQQAEAAQ